MLESPEGRDTSKKKATAIHLSRIRNAFEVQTTLRARVNALLSTDVPTNAPLMSIGLDSIAAVEFTNAVSDELGMSVSAIVLFDHPTLDSIASYLAAELELGTVEEAGLTTIKDDASSAVPGSTQASKQIEICIATACFWMAGSTSSDSALRQLVTRARATPSNIPLARWEASGDSVNASAAYGSFLHIEGLTLDGGAFGISALEARSMDPQQSLVLHVGYAALVCGRDSKNVRDGLVYSNVGVFVGVEPSGLGVQEAASVFSASGGAASITSGRLSYALGLVGPCYTMDTACSSALAALHVCSTATLREECERSVSVGTKVLSEAANYGTSIAGMTSPLGRCHTFDGRADGYCRGEGCGAF